MRFFEIAVSVIGLLGLSILLLTLLLLLLLFQDGSPLFFQRRVGRYEKQFTLVKFRTMKTNTRIVGTHEIISSQVTAWGGVLRKLKIDELPQLYNVLKGEMSLVGPRPCLPGQTELIAARRKLSVFGVLPGITGLAQIQRIDMSTPELLAKTDAEMIRTMSFLNYFKYIFLTVCGWGRGDRVVQSRNI